MSECGISSANSEYTAAPACLDQLTGSVAGISYAPKKHLLHRYNADTAYIYDAKSVATSDVPKQPIVASPLQAADIDSPRKSDVATSQLTCPVNSISHAPKKYLLHRYFFGAANADTANNLDVATQTENKCSLIKEMELSISQRDETIKQLREQIEAREHVTETSGGEVHDETKKEDSREMMMDDSSDSSDPDSDETPETDHTNASKNVHRNTRADDLMSIGKGKTMIPRKIFQNINWDSYTSATRTLMTTVFPRSVLATHSLTGRPSPAFPDRTPKKKLNETLVNDIIKTVAQRCCVAKNLVRACITTKCADESKMLRMRKNRVHKENIPPESDSD